MSSPIPSSSLAVATSAGPRMGGRKPFHDFGAPA